jgi:hypothetical protein
MYRIRRHNKVEQDILKFEIDIRSKMGDTGEECCRCKACLRQEYTWASTNSKMSAAMIQLMATDFSNRIGILLNNPEFILRFHI